MCLKARSESPRDHTSHRPHPSRLRQKSEYQALALSCIPDDRWIYGEIAASENVSKPSDLAPRDRGLLFDHVRRQGFYSFANDRKSPNDRVLCFEIPGKRGCIQAFDVFRDSCASIHDVCQSQLWIT